METSKQINLSELKNIISTMSIQSCCVTVLPEFELQWRDVSYAVKHAKLPMTPTSVAKVICQHAKTLPKEEIFEKVARLRLKLTESSATPP